MYITGAKFEEHCSNISRDILDSVYFTVLVKKIYVVNMLSVSNKLQYCYFFTSYTFKAKSRVKFVG